MIAVIQRVRECRVEVGKQTVGRIGRGLLVLLGVGRGDDTKEADYLADKIVNLRIFADHQGVMNLSCLETNSEILVVSQFTLLGDCRKGRRPSYAKAAPPDLAEMLYEYFVAQIRAKGLSIATGRFQAMMDVHLINDGPVTLIVESK
jgi:D-tyrosyl-tRNA(Tyr) deacylase